MQQKLTPKEVKSKLDNLAHIISEVNAELIELKTYFLEAYDVEEIQCISTDLSWAAENMTVLGLHQIGKALNDQFGKK